MKPKGKKGLTTNLMTELLKNLTGETEREVSILSKTQVLDILKRNGLVVKDNEPKRKVANS